MEKYAIVEFQNSLAGVVPTSWIFKKDGKIWCKWTASRTKTIACELPNPSWTTSSIKRVVAYRASYSEADNVCLGFEHSSTVEVTEADLNFPEADPATSSSTSNSKRNIFRPLHYTGEPNSNTANLMKLEKTQRTKDRKEARNVLFILWTKRSWTKPVLQKNPVLNLMKLEKTQRKEPRNVFYMMPSWTKPVTLQKNPVLNLMDLQNSKASFHHHQKLDTLGSYHLSRVCGKTI
ncbi:uncharacterized protein [Apostichopus japonicus]|uniref:uncharacterized protein isoform X1 n=1 Tax=Stichopus japonicus TaxID=307972 RepID=UPI003AB555AE